MIGNVPLRQAIQDATANITRPWARWFSSANIVLLAQTQAGTTENRPDVELYPGRRYFDTTLNKPIWYTGSAWVDATGASV